MTKALFIALCLFALTSVVDYSIEANAVDAQRGGAGRGGRGGAGGAGRGNWGGNGGGAKGADKDPRKAGNRGGRGNPWGGDDAKKADWEKRREEYKKKYGDKRGGVDIDTIPEWRMQRASTWMDALDNNMPVLLGFVDIDQALDAKLWVDKEIADMSRSEVLFVMCIEDHLQVGMEEEGKSKGPVTGDGADDEAEDAEKDDATKKDDDADADEDDGEEAEGEKAKKEMPDFFGSDEVAKDWTDADKRYHKEAKESRVVPASGFWYANMREFYEVKRNKTFVLCDPFGRELKRWTSTPSKKSIDSELEEYDEEMVETEAELQKHLDEAIKAQESGKERDMIEAWLEIFEIGVPGHPITIEASDMYFEALDDALYELELAREKNDEQAIKTLKKAWKGTDLDAEFEEKKEEADADKSDDASKDEKNEKSKKD